MNLYLVRTGYTWCRSLLDLSRGHRPHGVVNSEQFDKAAVNEKWNRIRTVTSAEQTNKTGYQKLAAIELSAFKNPAEGC